MQRLLLSERTPVSVLDAWLEQSMDPVFAEMTAGLAAGFSPEARVLVVVPKHVVHPDLLGGWRCRSPSNKEEPDEAPR